MTGILRFLRSAQQVADQATAEAVRQLMFIERVASEVGAQIERLET